MRSFRFAALGGVLLATIAASPVRAQQPAAGVKIAFLRSQAVVEQAPGRADAEAAYRKEVEGFRTQLEKMGDSLQKMIADYRKAETTLTAPQPPAARSPGSRSRPRRRPRSPASSTSSGSRSASSPAPADR